MISFRFHIVSITAVFLALAIGVVIGSTFVDQTLVDSLRSRIDQVSSNLDQRKATNDELERERSRLQKYIDANADFAVTDRLTDVPVLVVAVHGVDRTDVRDTALLARRAGAAVPGLLWVEPKWGSDAEKDLAELAGLIGSASIEPATLRSEAWRAVIDDLAGPEGTGAGTTTTVPGLPSTATTVTPTTVASAAVLDLLIEHKFFAVESLGDGPADLSGLADAKPRILIETGTSADSVLAPMVPSLVAESLARALPTVVGEIWVERKDGLNRGEAVTRALSDEIRSQVAIVDDVDLPQGRVAVVLALDAIVDNVTGHFGYGRDADAVLPRWSPP
jgi:hypothetical protein